VCLWLELCGAVENVVVLNFLVLPTSVFSFLCFLIVLHAIFVLFTFLLGILADHLYLALFYGIMIHRVLVTNEYNMPTKYSCMYSQDSILRNPLN